MSKNFIRKEQSRHYKFTRHIWDIYELGPIRKNQQLTKGLRHGVMYDSVRHLTLACIHEDDVLEYVSRVRSWLAQPTPAVDETRAVRQSRKATNGDLRAELSRCYKTIERLVTELEDCREQVRQFNQMRAAPRMSERVRKALVTYGD